MTRGVLVAALTITAYAAEPVIPVAAGKGNFLWKQVVFAAKGSRKSLKINFQGVLENQTQEKWGAAKFCVKAWDQSDQPIRDAATDCLLTLDANNIGAGGTLHYKYSPKTSLSPDKTPVTISRFEIHLAGGDAGEPNVRRFPATCDEVWAVTPAAISKAGLVPESTDRAGGFMRLKYIMGSTGWLKSDSDIKTLTTHRIGFLENYTRFQVAGGSLTLSPRGDECSATLLFEFQGFKRAFGGGYGWYAMQSNGRMESAVLEHIKTELSAAKNSN